MEHNKIFFCFYCGKKTELIYKDVRRPVNGKMTTINNVPLFSCKSCREVFFPAFVIQVLNKIQRLELDSSRYSFEDICKSTENCDSF